VSLFDRLAGIIGSFFQIGGPGGAGWNNNAGALEAKNSTNSTFAIARCADPVSNNDAVTLEYLNSSLAVYPNLTQHKIKWLNGETNAYNSSVPTAGVQYAGWSTVQFNSTTTTPAATTTTKLGATKRLRFQSTTAIAYVGLFESGYINAGVAQWGAWRGNAANRGGFIVRARFSVTSIGVSSTIHMFAGLIEAVGQATSSFDYTTDATTCKLGVGFTCTTTAGGAFPAQNWQAIESAHTAPHLTDLGAGFSLTLNDFIEIVMSAAPDDTKVTLTINNLTTGAANTVTLNTNLPTNTTMMGLSVAFGVQTITSGTDALDVSLVYVEEFDG
jgi:hypothetical protein